MTVWKGAKLHALQIDYEADRETLKTLAERHDICISCIVSLARRHRWRPRHGKWETGPLPPILEWIEQSRRGQAPA